MPSSLISKKLYAMIGKRLILSTFLSILMSISLFAQTIEKPTFTIDTKEIQSRLRNVKVEKDINLLKSAASQGGITIQLPTPGGELLNFHPIESPILSDELARKNPDVKTYKIYSENNIDGVLTTSPNMIHAYFRTGKGAVIISKVDDEKNLYYVEYEKTSSFNCEAHDFEASARSSTERIRATQSFSSGIEIRKYRIAIVTTDKFYEQYDIDSHATITSIINALSFVYLKDMRIDFELVAVKIYKPNNHPFIDYSPYEATMVFGNLAETDSDFEIDKYDIGHVVTYGSGGSAYVGTPCNNYNIDNNHTSPIKAGGFSGATENYFQTLIHEVAHQFSARHTFNSVTGYWCSGQIRLGSNYEPGSGSSFMSYYGHCIDETKDDNLSYVAGTREYFHINSVISISNYAFTSTGSTCGTISYTENNPPIVNPNPSGKSLKIPKGTPFYLEGSATDPDGDNLVYTWEQYDLGNTHGSAADARYSTDSPIFRSYPHTEEGNLRMFPNLSSILAGAEPNNDEALSQVARNINMRFTAKDNSHIGGGVSSEMITLEVVEAGPFLITSQNTSTMWYANGTNTATVTWSVNNTDKSPLNISKVKISLSKDEGETFPVLLGDDIPNDGSYTFVIPDEITTKGRIKIEPVGNHIFFDINNANISITTDCSPVLSDISPASFIEAERGNSILNLNMKAYSSIVTKIEGQLKNESITGNIVEENSYGGCDNLSDNQKHQIHKFYVSDADSYTFQLQNYDSGTFFSIYSGDYDPLNPCQNLIGTTNKYNVFYINLNRYLEEGDYTLVVSTYYYQAAFPKLPSDYSISISNGSGKYIKQYLPNENIPYSYSFLIKSNLTNKVTAILEGPDLSNETIFTPAHYTVYGLSHAESNFNDYIGQNFKTFTNALVLGEICGELSSTSRIVRVYGDCPPISNLNGLATSEEKLAENYIYSDQIISNGEGVIYSAGKSITLIPKEGSGFLVEAGAVFTAKIEGCP